MTDIVTRLQYEEPTGKLCLEARAEIERLRFEVGGVGTGKLFAAYKEAQAEIERLRQLLRVIMAQEFAAVPYLDYRAIRAALSHDVPEPEPEGRHANE